jgi:hypothetical protein
MPEAESILSTGGPVPPIRMPTRRRAEAGERIVAGAAALGALAVLCVAHFLRADPAGLGTHTQLGLPECGWITAAGIPCMTCGMTTAFAHAANARFIDSFLAQPMGLLLALATASAFWIGLFIAVTGSPLGSTLSRLLTWRVIGILLLIGTLAWIAKIIDYRLGLAGEP